MTTKHRFKGVVFDVDGTLITSSYKVSERMQETCRKLMKQGVWLSIASARPPKSVREYGEMIGSDGPLCALNGSIVVNLNGDVAWRSPIPLAVAQVVMNRFVGDARVSLNAYADDRWFVNAINEQVKLEASVTSIEPMVVDDFDSIGPVEKILLITDGGLAPSLADSIAKEHQGVAVSRSALGYIEITASGVDKSTGVEQAARLAGISPEELVACGDGENDIGMLQNAGHGIAMGHAHPSLKSAASQVVGSNNDDSLAFALQKLFNLPE